MAAAISAAFVCAAPLSANLRAGRDAPRASLWQQLYDRVPQGWKTLRTVMVQELNSNEMDRLTRELGSSDNLDEGDSIVDGYYQGPTPTDPPTISLLSSLKEEQASLVFLHEYAHFVWDEVLQGHERARFRDIWARSRRDHNLVTRYAAENPEEGFAEAAAFYLRRPNVLQQRDPAAFAFVEVAAARSRGLASR